MAFKYLQDLNGTHTPLVQSTVGIVAIKEGDALKIGASQNLAIPATVYGDSIIGVATHAVAAGGIVNYAPATDTAVFEVITTGTGYDEATYKYVTCDIGSFTSGSMAVQPGATSGTQILLLKLSEGETSGSAGNKVFCKFYDRAGQGA